jgi:hypothetical protein
MPTNNQNLPKDNLIIEITSSINAALYSAISNAIGKEVVVDCFACFLSNSTPYNT